MPPYLRTTTTDTGVAVVTMDAPDQAANTMDREFCIDLVRQVDELVAGKEQLTGIVITSAKKTFFAGGDLDLMMRATKEDAAAIYEMLTTTKAQFRRIETIGVPVVAAVNGSALGGGYEIALAAHHRVLLDAPGTRIGLPEVTLGLLPGAGGTTRTVRLFGLQKALETLLLNGRTYAPAAAAELGLVDELVEDPTDLLPRALAWIEANPNAAQPWDVEGYAIPGGRPADPQLAGNLPALPALMRKQLKGAPLPAPSRVLAAAVEGAQVDFDTALDIESRYCTELICGQASANIIKSQFFDTQQILKGQGRPDGFPVHRASKVAVIGAGMMGAAIAYVCADSGLDVTLKDVSMEAAERGKTYASKALAKRVAKGTIAEADASRMLDRIAPVIDPSDLSGADLVIEAVFENPSLKRQIFAEIEEHVTADAVLASNTSTLPISDLAAGVSRPEDFIGLHFFSPVDRMPLLEIVVGKMTSDATLAKAMDIARQIGKTPIVVNDNPGFFTTRVIVQYVLEAVAAVGEGIPASSIEQAATQAGYPVGPLALLDELTLTLLRAIYDQSARARNEGPADRHPGMATLERMIDLGRPGRSKGAGFYEYADGKRLRCWDDLANQFGRTEGTADLDELQERMLFTESLDTIRCLDEGVLRSVPDANIGSILGIGYPGWTGGVLQYVNQYAGGPQGFVARAAELAERHGARFLPPESLVALAKDGQVYA